MHRRFYPVTGFGLLISVLSLQGCGGGGGSSVSCYLGSGADVAISGQVTFDRIHHSSGGALDYANITQEPGRGLVVEAVCNSAIDTAITDASGHYSLSAPANTKGLIVRVKAQMLQTGAPAWNVSVVDNSRAKALYVMDSARFDMPDTPLVKNLHADSGWTGVSYAVTRVAAPFAILDTVYDAQQLILARSPTASFPALNINWHSENTVGTYYNGSEIFVLGKASSDTDEYDVHVIAHEWGHYFQDAFSRDDSVGGPHSASDILDIRVAFSEGFGNAFSAIVTGDPVYKDSLAGGGFNFNLESNACNNPGWYSECSVQSIFYDLYDALSDAPDAVNYGFGPLYDVLVNDMPGDPAFTSIFSFIHPLKSHPDVIATATAIDALVAGQSIGPITDSYGSGEVMPSVAGDDAIYATGTPVTLCNTGEHQGYNGLGVYRFLRITGAGASVTFTAQKSGTAGMSPADPDLVLFRNGQFITAAESLTPNAESLTATLDAGQDYMLQLYEYQYTDPDYVSNPSLDETCFDLTTTP